MAELTDAAIDAALKRGRDTHANEPRAATARYDRSSGRVIVDLENGCTFAFPPRLAQGLEVASDDQLATVKILGQGYGLHWEELDVDLSLPGLMAGLFGTKEYTLAQLLAASDYSEPQLPGEREWVDAPAVGREEA
ncbi:MAG: DUF2442 domain-containing protein [Oceanibaculum nanhaiense]|uniref:DUF2442 domain-containing protein n=1 Tax=Oceanibaculum nanhaiense TaxID=1909734 RepID=UPI0025A40DCC|nr:DUF2442 domain-containing protein [Oceanibaculum nanhaiense]MDM7947583.1 DUF2442 domain-containing protein [Oceanibaculum nanhaiense]